VLVAVKINMMKKPTKKAIENFVKKEFPEIEFDGIKIEDTDHDNCWFKIISYGRMIAQADYDLGEGYWNDVKKHLAWCFG
jgi:hypothetical protein